MLVKNFRLGLFELLRLYLFLRKFKKKKLHFNFFRLKNLFLFLIFACLRLTAKDLFLIIRRFSAFFLKKGNPDKLKTRRLKKTKYWYFLSLRALKTGLVLLWPFLAQENLLRKTLIWALCFPKICFLPKP
jgi:hypothetical protein